MTGLYCIVQWSKKVLKIHSIGNFWTDECCSSLSKLLSKWCEINFLKDLAWWLVVCCCLQTSRRWCKMQFLKELAWWLLVCWFSEFRALRPFWPMSAAHPFRNLSGGVRCTFWKILLDDLLCAAFCKLRDGSQNSELRELCNRRALLTPSKLLIKRCKINFCLKSLLDD